ncbi:HK97 family phage prohead protease [Wenxinia saemankumensis]|uniref:Prohead serine protease domain-containing protein n=1 Tax=Wenxinia saemankumensis TaxID=1447782 RepID=A0A1M6GME9_9RHOB|nr:HK97 family phage prohead protease [Wenxinia saemankumensis]SHJ11073.1 hypothetical protein SAMN05444417_2810 [Wenxinia saemankumensis]
MPVELETKTLPAALALEPDDRIAGYASLFGLRDQGGDSVEPGAYARSLARLRERGGRVRMLWQHDPAQPVGIWDVVREDGRGLWVEGRLLPDVARAREARALIAAGALDGLSIGYRALKAARGPDGTRRLTEIELWEVSLVTFPMQAEARLSAKAAPSPAEMTRLARQFDAARRLIAGPALLSKGESE